jgi:hypothetical protein
MFACWHYPRADYLTPVIKHVVEEDTLMNIEAIDHIALTVKDRMQLVRSMHVRSV